MDDEPKIIKVSDKSLIKWRIAFISGELFVCALLLRPVKASISSPHWQNTVIILIFVCLQLTGFLLALNSLTYKIILEGTGITIKTTIHSKRFAFADIKAVMECDSVCDSILTLEDFNGKRIKLGRGFLSHEQWNQVKAFISMRVPIKWIPR